MPPLADETIVTVFWLPGANWTVTDLPPIVKPFCCMDIICGEPVLFPCKLPTGKVNVIGFPCCPTPRIILTVPGVVCTEFVLLATADVIVFTCGDETNDTKLLADDVTIEPVCTVRIPEAVVTKIICWFVRIGRPREANYKQIHAMKWALFWCVHGTEFWYNILCPCLFVMTNAGLFVVAPTLPTWTKLEFFIRILLPPTDGGETSFTNWLVPINVDFGPWFTALNCWEGWSIVREWQSCINLTIVTKLMSFVIRSYIGSLFRITSKCV